MQEENPKPEQEGIQGIKFNIKTLKSDLEEREGEKLSLNLQKEQIPTKETKISSEETKQKFDFSGLVGDVEAPKPPKQQPSPAYNHNTSAIKTAVKDAGAKETAEQEAEKPGIKSFPTEQTVIKFEKQDRKKISLPSINIFYLIPILAIFVGLFGFWLYKKFTQETPKAPLYQQIPGNFTTTTTPTSTEKTIPAIIPTITLSATTTPTSTPKIILPSTTSIQKATTAAPITEKIPIKPSPVISKTDEPKSPKISQPTGGTQKEITPIKPAQTSLKPALWIFGLPAINEILAEINIDNFKKAQISSLRHQKSAGTIWVINFSINSQKLPADFIVNYFINPTFIEKKYIENFKKSIGPNYEIVYYYTHTRKFPMLIFEINNDLTAVPFLKLWDTESMTSDFKNLYNGVSSGKFTRKYMVTKNYGEIDYRIAFKDDDYKFIWSVYNNKLIISSTISGFQILIDKLKEFE